MLHRGNMRRSLNELEQKIGITFKNTDLAHEALTHRSYREENQSWPFLSNERLEYLGDAVLQFIVTDFLFRRYPDKQEGELTKIRSALVNAHMLARVAEELNVSEYLSQPHYESSRQNSLGDDNPIKFISSVCFDFDGELITEKGEGFSKPEAEKDAAKRALEKIENCFINPERSEKLLPLHIDEIEKPIGYLQEIRAKEGRIRPRYETVSDDGTGEDKIFQVEVILVINSLQTEEASESRKRSRIPHGTL